jgi:hypothetical protein
LYLPFYFGEGKYYSITLTIHNMSYNARQDDVYRQLKNLVQSIRMDSYNLTRDEQDFLELKLDEFKKLLDEKYNK